MRSMTTQPPPHGAAPPGQPLRRHVRSRNRPSG
jgi:hypothetical protein